jgi:MoxR-like ATPase
LDFTAQQQEQTSLRATRQLIGHGRTELGKIVAGQRAFLDQAILTVLCRGHALIEGVPGVAKTLMVKLLGQMLTLEFQRVQCTPDLMPGDILGTNIYRPATQQFVLHHGPVFSSFLLVDEINRMPPRTQSALLECMEERQVTIDGTRHALPEQFTVFATQNPVDFEGTYPLPEAQLDRFFLKLRVSYPSLEEEHVVLERHQRNAGVGGLLNIPIEPAPPGLLSEAQQEVRRVRIEPELTGYMLAIVRKSREWPMIQLGASPRAAIALMIAAQAFAALDDRNFVLPDDVKQAVLPVLRHRLTLRPEAELDGYDTDRILLDIIASVPVPSVAASSALSSRAGH